LPSNWGRFPTICPPPADPSLANRATVRRPPHSNYECDIDSSRFRPTRSSQNALKFPTDSRTLDVGRSKETYLAAQYQRLAARRGKKRAALAVAHTILVIAYHVLRRRQPYRELGPNFFDERDKTHVQRHLVQRLEKLGFTVELHPAA